MHVEATDRLGDRPHLAAGLDWQPPTRTQYHDPRTPQRSTCEHGSHANVRTPDYEVDDLTVSWKAFRGSDTWAEFWRMLSPRRLSRRVMGAYRSCATQIGKTPGRSSDRLLHSQRYIHVMAVSVGSTRIGGRLLSGGFMVALLCLGGLAAAQAGILVAAAHGTFEQVSSLIGAGADVNVRNWDGITPVAAAAVMNPDPRVLSALLAAGGDPGSHDVHGATPLMAMATLDSNPSYVGILVEAGADVNARGRDGLTALHYAARNSHSGAMVEQLLRYGADIDAIGADVTPLNYGLLAAHEVSAPAVKSLLRAGADPNAVNPNGWTALMLALWNNASLGTISDLLEFGADVNAEDNVKWTPIMFAGRFYRDPGVIGLLIEHGIQDIDHADGVKTTALYWAARENLSASIIDELLAAGADPNTVASNGETPLMAAAARNGPEVVLALLEADVDTKRTDYLGRRALDLASSNPRLVGTDAFWRLNDLSY